MVLALKIPINKHINYFRLVELKYFSNSQDKNALSFDIQNNPLAFLTNLFSYASTSFRHFNLINLLFRQEPAKKEL